MFSKPTRVSPAMGVALVALAFAVSGSPFAEGAATKIHKLISGSSIKKGSIPANRLRAADNLGHGQADRREDARERPERDAGTARHARRSRDQRATRHECRQRAGARRHRCGRLPQLREPDHPVGRDRDGRLRRREQRHDCRDDHDRFAPASFHHVHLHHRDGQRHPPGRPASRPGARRSERRDRELRQRRRGRYRPLVHRDRCGPDRARGQGLPVPLGGSRGSARPSTARRSRGSRAAAAASSCTR